MQQYRTRFSFRDQVEDPDAIVEAEPVEDNGVQLMRVVYPEGAVVVMDDGIIFLASPCCVTMDYFNKRYEPVTRRKGRYYANTAT